MLRRRRPFREPLPRLLIVCEGAQTEPSYFHGMRHLQRIPIQLVVVPAGTPKTVVERAVAMKRSSQRDARKNLDANLRYDEVWCVFDIDEHPLVPEATDQAMANNIELAISNPCFELWILLHFQDQRAHIERANVQRSCRTHLPDYEKTVACEELLPRHDAAVTRATKLDAWRTSRQTTGANPSTGVYRLAERIRQIGLARN